MYLPGLRPDAADSRGPLVALMKRAHKNVHCRLKNISLRLQNVSSTGVIVSNGVMPSNKIKLSKQSKANGKVLTRASNARFRFPHWPFEL